MLVVGIVEARADTLETVTFSGTLESSLGVISAGDTFSGTMTWDLSTLGAVFADIAEATAFSFTMPPDDGLSVAGLPDSQILFAGATYSAGSFVDIQINDVSTVDGNTYVFYVGPSSGALLLNDAGNADVYTNFSFSGPTASTTPEPATNASFAIGLGLMAALALRRRLDLPRS
jgi:hypothetical protein